MNAAMEILLTEINSDDLPQYKEKMQEAFQKGYEAIYGETDAHILPEEDIDASLRERNARAYKAVVDGELAGGAIIVANSETQCGSLDFLFVKHGIQNRGIGKKIWAEIERLHPDIKIWETCTPCFEKRNIYFYVNVCGFHMVNSFFENHAAPDTAEGFSEKDNEEMLEFQKQM